MQSIYSHIWFSSFETVSLQFISVALCSPCLFFLLMCRLPRYEYLAIYLSILFEIDIWVCLDCLQFGAIMKKLCIIKIFFSFYVWKTRVLPHSLSFLWVSFPTHPKYSHFWDFWSPNLWRFFPVPNSSLQPQQGVLPFKSILTLSTQKSIRYHRPQSHETSPPPPPHFYFQSQARWWPCFWPTDWKNRTKLNPGFKVTCWSGSQTSEKHFTYFYLFITKGYNRGYRQILSGRCV